MRRRDLRRDERGVTSIEYGLIATAIAVVVLVFVFAIGTAVVGLFDSFVTKLTDLASL